MVMKLSQSKEQDIPLVKDLFFHGSSGNVVAVSGLINALVQLCLKEVEAAQHMSKF